LLEAGGPAGHPPRSGAWRRRSDADERFPDKLSHSDPDKSLADKLSHSDPDKSLANGVAGQHRDERVGAAVEALEDRLAVAQPAVGEPAAEHP
jgi:hypothetical protein